MTAVARELGIAKSTLYVKLKKFDETLQQAGSNPLTDLKFGIPGSPRGLDLGLDTAPPTSGSSAGVL